MKSIVFKILFFPLLILSCTSSEESNIYYNQNFEDTYALASKLGCNYCVVLVDSTQEMSNLYKEKIKIFFPLKTAICNIVDVGNPMNEWYMKWLCPVSLPLACVFSADGTLIDLIPGASKESFLYTKEALLKSKRTNFHYVNRFNLKKENIIPLFDQILKCSMGIKQGFFSDLDNAVIDSLKYPYPHYLRILGNIIYNDTITAQIIAEEIVKMENPLYLDLYKNEFILAKKIINPKFDICNEPTIRVNKELITFLNYKMGETIPFDITLYNDGETDLKVSKIFKSCSCLELEGTDNFIIPPKDSIKLDFTFNIEQQGEVIRDIYITSNAINAPILYIKVLANIL